MPVTRLDEVFAAGKGVPRSDPRPDADLLTRFLAGDDGAFEALVVRYTPTLRAVCRGWLAAPADVDDAVQATFLILVRRATAIRRRAALGGWLCGVAENVSRRLKGQMRRHAPLPDDVPARATADDGTGELVAVEVARLPEKYRRPVQLCYFGGLTTAEAAERLGWPRNTVLTRLARAKKQLYGRLLARGAAPGALATIAATRGAAPAAWQVWGTMRAARGLLTGATPGDLGLSERTVSVIEGVVHAMIWNKLKYAALAALLTAAVIGFGVGRWATATAGPADDRRTDPTPTSAGAAKPAAVGRDEGPKEAAPPRIEEGKPGIPGKRREAVIRLPVGTYTKDVDVPPYGAGRVTWTYEEERVLGVIEASVMGFELEIHTEAEYALSGNGTIFGLLTGFKIAHFKFPVQGELAEFGQYAAFWPLIEPMVTEFFTDMPFSYQFRLSGDRLSITNYRALLAGPNPFGKAGAALALGDAGEGIGMILAAFQAFGLAMEGNYTLADAKPEAPKRKAPFLKPRAGVPANPPALFNRNRSLTTSATVPNFPLPREPQAAVGVGTGAVIGGQAGPGGIIGGAVGAPVVPQPAPPPARVPSLLNRNRTFTAGMTLPSPHYLENHRPQYIPDDSAGPPTAPVVPPVMPRAEAK